MEPTSGDVKEMVRALMAVVRGLKRAERQGQAGTLTTLSTIAAYEQIRLTDLSLELGLHQSSVTRQVQALEAASHVQVAVAPEDGRSRLVSITDLGREELRRLTEVGLGRFALFVEGWEADEVRLLARLLTKLEASKAKVGKRE